MRERERERERERAKRFFKNAVLVGPLSEAGTDVVVAVAVVVADAVVLASIRSCSFTQNQLEKVRHLRSDTLKKVLVFLAKNTSLTQMNSSKLEIFNLALIFFCYAHTTSDSYGFNPATYFIA